MNSGSVTSQARSFRDLKAICRRADIMMLDHQRRDDDTGFQQNGDTGKRVHGLLGWDKLAPESMALYQSGPGLLPRRQQAGRRGADVDDCGHRRRHPAVVAPRRRVSRGPAHVPHRRAGDALVEDERALSGRSAAGGDRRLGVVAAQHRLLRPRRSGRAGGCAVHRLHARAGARAHPLRPGSRATMSIGTTRWRLSSCPTSARCRTRRPPRSAASCRAADRSSPPGDTGLYTEWGDPRPDFALADLFGCHRVGPTPPLGSAGRAEGASAPAACSPPPPAATPTCA